ncbi:PAS domain S-box protein [Thioalbus denitrificans]|uniref:cyclic-guanylate-specific phosphodiesterase n=1 Tax=Thioalbus denitrificans TaxID=547122 RepID=A0A369C3C0_9GAMM|nr:PAS domain S-box protein [Thioalbus denitrificans]RCX26374.1 periplasmic sensor diguanylate cyclase/phosphodiesterase [Thioalbus denitrificans]
MSQTRPRLTPLNIALGYGLLAALWIFISDGLILELADGTAHLHRLQTLKGWAFVGVTAILLFLVINRLQRQLVRSRRELAASEAHYRNLVENVSDAVAVLDARGIIHYQNPSSETLLGYHPGDLEGRDVFEIIHPEDQPRARARLEALVAHPGSRTSLELRLLRHDHAWAPVEAAARSDLHTDGRIEIAVVSRDISDRLRVQREVEQHQADLESLLRLSGELASSSEFDRIASRALQTAARLLGLDTCALMQPGPDGDTLVARQVLGWPAEHVNRIVLSSGEGISSHVLHTRRPATVLDYSREQRFTAPPAVLEHGMRSALAVPMLAEEEVTGVLVGHTRAVRQFTEREIALLQTVANQTALTLRNADARAALSASEARHRSLVEQLQEGIFRTDAKGRATFLNPAWETITGFPVAEALGQCIFNFTPWRERTANKRRFYALLTGESAEMRDEIRFRTRDGSPRWIQVHARRIEDETGAVIGCTGTLVDISEQRRLKHSLEESEARLRSLINATPDIICFKDGDGRWLEANAADLDLFELESVDYRNHTDIELAGFSPAYRKYFEACVLSDDRAWRHGAPSRGEERITRADGVEKVYDVIKVPLYDPDGSRRGLVVLGRDVTEQSRALEALSESERRYRQIFENNSAIKLLIDPADLTIVDANPAAAEFYGYPLERLRGMRMAEINPLSREAIEAEKARARSESRPLHFRHRLASGEMRTIQAHVGQVEVDGRELDYAIIQDVTDRQRAEEQLRLAARVFESTNEGVVVTDTDGIILTVNNAFERITGYGAAEVKGQNPRILKSDRHDELFYRTLWENILTTGQWQGEIWNRRKSGEIYPEWLTISAVRDTAGETTHFVGVFADISAIKESEQQLEHLAHHDPLTGLPNRLLFNARLAHALQRARREQSQVAVLFLDLDRFKNVNDSLGHPAGDRLIQAVAGRLVGCVRDQDTVARLGGDEITIIAEDIRHSRDAAAVAQKVLEAFARPFALDDQEVYITASMGVSLFPDDGGEVATLVKNADAAMYRAKAQGRNNYQFYTAELTTMAFERLALESSLRRALERGELVLHYQPQVACGDGRITGLEALVRWRHPEMGLVAPGRFIPIAEETGLIIPLGAWVLEAACRQAHVWHTAGHPGLTLSVNLSARQFQQPDLVETVERILAETGLEAGTLELELTESAFTDNAEEAVRSLHRLKALGVTLAIDDFGTGYSSLSQIKQFPIDRLKIDKSFVDDIPHDADDMTITRAIIALGRSLQMEVVAEGVETEAQRAFLEAEGCDTLQGFLFSTPVPAEAFGELLQREAAENKPV